MADYSLKSITHGLSASMTEVVEHLSSTLEVDGGVKTGREGAELSNTSFESKLSGSLVFKFEHFRSLAADLTGREMNIKFEQLIESLQFYSPSPAEKRSIIESLNAIRTDKNLPVLMRIRAETFGSMLQGQGDYWSTFSNGYTQLTHEVFARGLYGTISLSKPESAAHLKHWISLFRGLEIESSRNSDPVICERMGICSSEMQGHFHEVLSQGELSIVRADSSRQQIDSAERMKLLFSYVTNDPVRDAVSEKVNFDLKDLSVKEQYYLFAYLSESGTDQFEALLNFVDKYGPTALKVIVASEYDPGLASAIIDFGNRSQVPVNELEHLFRLFNMVSQESEKFSKSLFATESVEGLGGVLGLSESDQVSEALTRRTVDILNSVVLNSENLEAATQALNGLFLTLKVVNDFGLSQSFSYKEVLNPHADNKVFLVSDKSFGTDYKLKIFARPRAENQGQARVSFELDFDTDNPNLPLKGAYKSFTIYPKNERNRRTKTKESASVRISLDLEDVPGTTDSRVSMDIGRSAYNGQSFSRTGDILGNLLASVAGSGSHTPQSFLPYLSDKDAFASVVERVSDKFGYVLSSD